MISFEIQELFEKFNAYTSLQKNKGNYSKLALVFESLENCNALYLILCVGRSIQKWEFIDNYFPQSLQNNPEFENF